MKLHTSKILVFAMILLAGVRESHSQGFVNLNFESANVSGYSPGTFNVIPTATAFPGWTALYFTTSTTNIAPQVSYDVLPLGSAAISIGDTNLAQYGFGPLTGLYSAFLFGVGGTSSGLSQSGLVPTGTESLLINVSDVTGVAGGSFVVMLGGQIINMIALQSFSNHTLYGGNVASFAGQVAPLTLVAPPVGNPFAPNGWAFDSITFSSSPVPEPGTLVLVGLGGLLLGLRRWKK